MRRYYDVACRVGTFEQIIEMGKNNDYPTGNLLDYKHFSKH